MARFDSYRNLLKNFKKEIEGVYSKQSDEIEYVNKNYKPEAVGNAVKNVKAEYAPSFLAIRKNYLKRLHSYSVRSAALFLCKQRPLPKGNRSGLYIPLYPCVYYNTVRTFVQVKHIVKK